MINTCYQREELEPADLECMWIEIDYHTFSYLLYCIYRPPSSDSTNWTKFSWSLDKVSEYSDKIIIVCDLNLDLFKVPLTNYPWKISNYSKCRYTQQSTAWPNTDLYRNSIVRIGCIRNGTINQSCCHIHLSYFKYKL